MSEHTKEPWAIDPDDRLGMEWNNHIVSVANPDRTICFMSHDGTPENIEFQANARRIVDCVNACAGMTTEEIEADIVVGGYRALLACRDSVIATLEQQVAAMTKERDGFEISNSFAHGEWKAVKDQLVAAQARESKLRELWEVVEKEYFARLKEQDEEAAKFEAEKDMYGWNFHKGLRGGLVEFHIYMTKIVKALALPTDDSALMERLKQEYERGYADAAEILTGVDRSMT